ncbi:MMPL family transporter [Rhabdothermincola sediminis]|uniref:MMPL family transporter n=1 Tax=Rhabdothermincola sediminis TaxID=2751370 RepID=UPI001AA01708|nr:MMPL family transporter [Rhabdothermincola sediminis]
MFRRIGSWCHDHRRLVVVSWVAALLVSSALSNAVGSGFRQEFNLPDVESKQGLDLLEQDFGGRGTGFVGTIVFFADRGVSDPAVRDRMQALFDDVARIDGVARVQSPYAPGGERQISARGPSAGKIAFADVELRDDVDFDRAAEIRDRIRAEQPRLDGLQIELGGSVFADFDEPSSEILGLAFAIVILILAFGSVLAMGLPVGVALFGIGVGTAMVTLLSNVLAVPDFSTILGVMIGLGVGIDYALLIVTRFREQLHIGHRVGDSVAMAIDTAGRSVLFAGMTVVISLLGMVLMGVNFVQGLAVAAAAVVGITVMASLTLLPALLGFAGERVERTRWRGLLAAGMVAVALVGIGLGVTPLVLGLPVAAIVLVAGLVAPPLKREVPRRPPKPRQRTTAYRWSRIIQQRPWPFAVAGVLSLIVLALPVLGLRLGFSDESNFAEETSTRRAYDLLVEGFGPGFNGPLMLVAELPPGTDPGGLSPITEAVGRDPGVVYVSPPQPNDPASPTAVLWTVVPTSGPQEKPTTELVNRLRSEVLPPAEDQVRVQVAVTGRVAVAIDFASFLSSRLPYFFAAVLALSFLLLMVVFRSVLVPLKAVIMNLLSIGAAYGIAIALFQWGWLSDLTGVQPAPIEPWVPMMLFAIVFGLSMDYEVFLLSRVREEWHRTGDSRASVADGLAATAKVITAAAAIMVFVFGSFVLERDRLVKLMGTGLATAILLDATVVRMLLVPATMELLGDRNWWLPRWLDRIIPDVDVEGHAGEPPPDEEPEPGERRPEPVGAS